MKTFEYRLYPQKAQSHLLMQCLIESRGIYNGMLEMVKAQYEDQETFPSKYDLEAVFKGQGEHVPATTVQMLADRLSKSLKGFLVSSSPIVGTLSNSDNTARIAMCMRTRNTSSCLRNWGTSSRSSCIAR